MDSGPRPAAPYGPFVPAAGVAPKAEVPKQNPMVQALAIGFADFMESTPFVWWNVFLFFFIFFVFSGVLLGSSCFERICDSFVQAPSSRDADVALTPMLANLQLAWLAIQLSG